MEEWGAVCLAKAPAKAVEFSLKAFERMITAVLGEKDFPLR